MKEKLEESGKDQQRYAKEKEELPLVLEIMPGQAREGLIQVFQPNEYKEKKIEELVQMALEKPVSVEDRDILQKIRKELDGGKILYNNREVEGDVLKYAVKEKTEAGEEYFYVGLRAIRPQEGGLFY